MSSKRDESQRLCRLMCGGGCAPPSSAPHKCMGFALGSGSALNGLGRRPNEGHSPKFLSSRGGAQPRRTSGGEAAASDNLL
jgi:hypothetical protein